MRIFNSGTDFVARGCCHRYGRIDLQPRRRSSNRFGHLAALAGDDAKLTTAREQFGACIRAALVTAVDPQQDVVPGKRPWPCSRHAGFDAVGPALMGLIDPQQPVEIQSAAIHALAGMSDPSISRGVSADRFAAYSPVVREEVLAAMFSSKAHLPGLLTATESGPVLAWHD